LPFSVSLVFLLAFFSADGADEGKKEAGPAPEILVAAKNLRSHVDASFEVVS